MGEFLIRDTSPLPPHFSLMATRLIPQLAPFPPGFRGNLNKFAKAFVDRLVILLPDNGLQWIIGGIKPTSNQGPWLKDGQRPYVWDEDAKDYIPMILTDSLTDPFWFGPDTPAATTPSIWFKTVATPEDGYWMRYNGTDWVVLQQPVASGTTAQRPASPYTLQRFWDTTINAEIHFERGIWRTVAGTPGDIKFVNIAGADYAAVVTAAQLANPGWTAVSVDFQGRSPAFAGSGAGLTARAPLAAYGAENVTLAETQLPAHRHNLSAAGTLQGDLVRLAVNTSGSARPLGKNGDTSPDLAPPTTEVFSAYQRDPGVTQVATPIVSPTVALVGLQKD